MTDYLVSQAWNNTTGLAALAITTQPRTETVEPGRTQWGGDQLQYTDGAYDTVLEFAGLKDADFTLFNTQLGIDYETQSAKITIYLPHREQNWKVWNAVVSFPEAPHSPLWFVPVRYPLKLVQELVYTP